MNLVKMLLIGVSAFALSVQTAAPKALPQPENHHTASPPAAGQDISRNW